LHDISYNNHLTVYMRARFGDTVRYWRRALVVIGQKSPGSLWKRDLIRMTAALASNTRLCKRSSQRQARRRAAGTTGGFRNTNPRAETLRKSQPVVRLPRQN